VAWDTQFSPVDVRKLAGRHIRESGGRLIFDRTEEGRQKTDTAVIGTLSRRTERLVRVYLKATFGDATLMPDAQIFRTRGRGKVPGKGGKPWAPRPYTKDSLGDDFAEIRTAEFGPGEKRQLQDMRRSAGIEAIAGGADPAALANKMGNSIDKNRELQITYVPNHEAIVRTVDGARLIGRRRIRAENS
jgi:hypothetical protein